MYDLFLKEACPTHAYPPSTNITHPHIRNAVHLLPVRRTSFGGLNLIRLGLQSTQVMSRISFLHGQDKDEHQPEKHHFK